MSIQQYTFPSFGAGLDPDLITKSFSADAPNVLAGLSSSGPGFADLANTGFKLAGSFMPALTGGGSSGTAPWAQGLQAAGGLAATFGGPWGAAAGIGANLIAGLFGSQNREEARSKAMEQAIGANVFNRSFGDLADFNTEQRKIALAGSPAAKRVYGRDLRSDLAYKYGDPFERAFASRGSGATY